MGPQDRDAGVLDALDPWPTRDVMAGVPHEDTAEHPAQGHHRNVMAHQRLQSAARPRDEPQLRQHRDDAEEEAGHPQRVEERPAVQVRVQQGGAQEASQDHRQHGQGVVGRVVAASHPDHAVQKGDYHDHRKHIESLEDPIPAGVDRQVAIQPCRRRQAAAQCQGLEPQGARRNAGGITADQSRQAEEGHGQALDHDRQREQRRKLTLRDEVIHDAPEGQKDAVGHEHLDRWQAGLARVALRDGEGRHRRRHLVCGEGEALHEIAAR
mmetsp:Transcript_57887/g.167783  ORF Transcript_57887/g.167783 Transcript_57887/m.167783 type:complete len:267 (+) Transcript_57887:235-1035(+)